VVGGASGMISARVAAIAVPDLHPDRRLAGAAGPEDDMLRRLPPWLGFAWPVALVNRVRACGFMRLVVLVDETA
jgi:hypothetical protein